MSQELTIREAGDILVPTEVFITQSVDEAEEFLDGIGRAAASCGWTRAAYVYAHTEEGKPGRPGKNGNPSKSAQISITDFAAKGIYGLKTRKSVGKYRRRWEEAIEKGLVEPAEPGKLIQLPDEPFEVDREPTEDKEPASRELCPTCGHPLRAGQQIRVPTRRTQ